MVKAQLVYGNKGDCMTQFFWCDAGEMLPPFCHHEESQKKMELTQKCKFRQQIIDPKSNTPEVYST